MNKQLTILHSNDLHGDFLAEQIDDKLIGGAAMLSGYVAKTRQEKDNVIYCIAGDMFKGSIIDAEFQGLSTIEIMNALSPDVVTVGNHEVDYGVAHLLFLEKCAKFPIVNANMFIKTNHARLFTPYKIIEVNGLNVMFIGILTEEVLAQTKGDGLVGTFIDVEDAAHEVQIILDNYKTTKVDLTVLLTHIGFDKDQQLASLISDDWGVDLIIGGHTHTLMDEPCVVNGIPIVQAGTGTDQIGRFEIEIDDKKHKMISYKWQCLPINADNCPVDRNIEKIISIYKDQTDAKYNHIITQLARQLTHPVRNRETELGDLFADIMQQGSSFDVMLYGSGSIRVKDMGPLVTYAQLKESSPYDDKLYMLQVSGCQFKKMMAFVLREEALNGEHTEFYQVSQTLGMTWCRSKQQFVRFELYGKPVDDDQRVKIALQSFHFNNFDDFFNLSLAEVTKEFKPRVVAVSIFGIIEEMMACNNHMDVEKMNRIVLTD